MERNPMKAKIENGVVNTPYPDCTSKECKSVLTVLKDMADNYGSKVALIHKDDKLTYPELLTRIQSCAAGFQSEGLGAGDRVYVHVDNGIESFAAICGIIVVGATFITSAISLDAEEIRRRIKVARATHLITEERYTGTFSMIKEHHPLKGTFTVRERIPGFKCVRGFHGTPREQDIREGACTFVDWSSGTTGPSKWSERPEKYFLQQIVCSATAQVLTAEDAFLGSLNVSSGLGFVLYFLALHVGAEVTIVESLSSIQEIYEASKKLEVTTIFASPWNFRCLLDAKTGKSPFILKVLRESITKILLTGSPAEPEFEHELTCMFRLKELRCIYGMTDVGAFLTIPPSGEICGAGVGFPAPLSKMKLVDPHTTNVLAPMEVGEVLVYIQYIPADHYGDIQRPGDFFIDHDGWIHTGDLGYYDNDGRLFLCGRIKTAMRCMAKTVFPSDIEQCLLQHPLVKDVGVLGLASPVFGDAPTAVVVTKGNCTRDMQLADDLQCYVKERLPIYKHLHGGVYFADVVPRTAMGKINYFQLRKLIGSQEGGNLQ